MKKLTINWLKKHNACKEAVIAFGKSGITNLFETLNVLIKSKEKEKPQWANWLIVRVMNKKQKVQYAIFAAKLVIDIFEKKYPDDNQPRREIEAAEKYLRKQTKGNRKNATYATYADYDDDAAADAAAFAIAYATVFATNAASTALGKKGTLSDNYNKTLIKILNNGMKILNNKL